MDLDTYNRSFEETLDTFEEEADRRLQLIRQQCVADLINRLNRRQREWENVFRGLLNEIQDGDQNLPSAPTIKDVSTFFDNNLNSLKIQEESQNKLNSLKIQEDSHDRLNSLKTQQESQDNLNSLKAQEESQNKLNSFKTQEEPPKVEERELDDIYFSNHLAIKEYIRIQQLLEQHRQLLSEINTHPNCKGFKNELSRFITTQINSISNSDSQHLNSKIQALTNLFSGNRVTFQDRFIEANKHSQGTLFCMHSAAQSFVNVGTRLVNSVPAIASSMATVINGITSKNLPQFKDLITGYLQEKCPYLVPMNPQPEDFPGANLDDVKYKIACGYSYDLATKTLETEEKYLTRMRSMVLIYACILVQEYIQQAWSWLAAFLSLKPQPVVTATVLQAFLQEASKKMSSTYGRQYDKLVAFIRTDYVKMIEEVTKPSERQSLIKLKNLLADNSKLIAQPTMSSIFGRG